MVLPKLHKFNIHFLSHNYVPLHSIAKAQILLPSVTDQTSVTTSLIMREKVTARCIVISHGEHTVIMLPSLCTILFETIQLPYDTTV